MFELASIIYNINPQFLWHSDYCNECDYSIRIAEYISNIHQSPQEALLENLLLPMDRSIKFYDLPSNSNLFQPNFDGLITFEVENIILGKLNVLIIHP